MIYNNTNLGKEININYELHDKNIDKPLYHLQEINNILDDDNYFHDEELDNYLLQNNNYDDDDNNDQYTSLLIDYHENYNMKLLHHIANYYNISKRKMKKEDLISLIVEYENDPDNSVIVYNRKKYWNYIQELQKDKYFSKFIAFY